LIAPGNQQNPIVILAGRASLKMVTQASLARLGKVMLGWAMLG